MYSIVQGIDLGDCWVGSGCGSYWARRSVRRTTPLCCRSWQRLKKHRRAKSGISCPACQACPRSAAGLCASLFQQTVPGRLHAPISPSGHCGGEGPALDDGAVLRDTCATIVLVSELLVCQQVEPTAPELTREEEAELQQLPEVPTKRPQVAQAQHTDQSAVPDRQRAAEEPIAA